LRRILTLALVAGLPAGFLAALLLLGGCAPVSRDDSPPVSRGDSPPSGEEIWQLTGSLNYPRDAHTATLLDDGTVLVAGGYDGAVVGSAELYDPVSGTWVLAGVLDTARSHHTSALLQGGDVLLAGGYGSVDEYWLASAELYDPVPDTWAVVGTLETARHSHTATLLADGKVLVVGGEGACVEGGASESGPCRLASAELFDPDSRMWSPTGDLHSARSSHTSTLLEDGRVLVAGGEGSRGLVPEAEIYDPKAGTWTASGALRDGRHDHSATLLMDGRVLVAGGVGEDGYLASAEFFDPPSGTWHPTGFLRVARGLHGAVLLPDGRVLLPGGERAADPELEYLTSVEIYNPATGNWTVAPDLHAERARYTLSLLQDGTVLVVGGYDGNDVIGGAELLPEESPDARN